jgi:hypothetical protein
MAVGGTLRVRIRMATRMSAAPSPRFAIALLSIVSLFMTSAPAAAAQEASARDRHAAQCVAALEAHAQELAKRVLAGNEVSRAVLMARLVAGAAFVGDTYLHSDSDEQQARALTDEAREAQKKLPAPELAARTAACADEGTKLYAASNSVQQIIVKRLAKKRMQKLLGA